MGHHQDSDGAAAKIMAAVHVWPVVKKVPYYFSVKIANFHLYPDCQTMSMITILI